MYMLSDLSNRKICSGSAAVCAVGGGRSGPRQPKMLSFVVLGAWAVQRANVELSMQQGTREGADLQF